MRGTIAGEEVEDACHDIGEEVHEHGGPKDPGEVASFLHHIVRCADPARKVHFTSEIMLAVDFPTNPPICIIDQNLVPRGYTHGSPSQFPTQVPV